MEDDALACLGEIGARTSLRFAVQLITPSNILSGTAGREKINRADVEEIDALFCDAKRSAKILAANEEAYLE